MIPGYNIPLRKDRVSKGGGVAMYIADYLPYVRKHEFDCPDMELLCVEVILNKFKFYVVFAIGLPIPAHLRLMISFAHFRTA